MKEIEISTALGKELDSAVVKAAAARALGVKETMVGECRVIRRSIDARKEPLWKYRMAVARKDEQLPDTYELKPYKDVH